MSRRRTVVLGEFGPIFRLGLRSALVEAGCYVIADGAPLEKLHAVLSTASVEAVILNLDAPLCATGALRLLAEHPGLSVIGCSAERTAMRVFRAGGGVDERPLTAAALGAAIAEGDG
ncbi:MAG: hypothetical protein ABR521_10195 [Gaiellaceae bacterium]